MRVPRAERKELYLPPDEFARALEFTPNADIRDLMIITYQTGCRPQELLIVEARHFDEQNQRWVFELSESKMKRISRIVYLTDEALQIVKRALEKFPTGPIFRNSNGRPWTTDAVNCHFTQLQIRLAKEEMKRRGISVSDDEVNDFIKTLAPTKRRRGEIVRKTDSELRHEAKTKLRAKLAKQLVPRYSLYALRHSWATNALQRGLDSLTVAILMGHEDPSTLARVYQHLGHNPEHLLGQAKRAASQSA
jgi:integrase